MTKKFGVYSEALGLQDVNGEVGSTAELDGRKEEQTVICRSEEKYQKKVLRKLKKLNKAVQQDIRLRKAELAHKDEKRSNEVGKFIQNIGRAICKALPAILTSLAGAVFNYFFKGKFGRKGLRAA